VAQPTTHDQFDSFSKRAPHPKKNAGDLQFPLRKSVHAKILGFVSRMAP